MREQRRHRGILDTSVVIELERIDPVDLPIELAVSAVTLAELAAGPHATSDPRNAPAARTGCNGPRPPLTLYPWTER